MLNDWAFGGALIHAGVRPFIDGRADMYGGPFLRAYQRINAPDRAALDAAVERYGIRWTLLPPGSPVVPVLDLLPGWCRVHSDAAAVVHARGC